MSEDLSRLLDCISWGHRIVEVDQQTIVFRPLTTKERNIADFIYKQKLNQLLIDGLPSKNTLRIEICSMGLWSDVHDDQLNKLKNEIDDIKEQIAKFSEQNNTIQIIKIRDKKKSTKLRKLEKRLAILEKRHDDLYDFYTSNIELPSAEYAANYERGLYILQCATLLFPELEQKWGSFEDLKESKDTQIILKLFTKYHKGNTTDISQIRKLARSGLWRIKWNTAKSCGAFNELFNICLSDITDDQLMLIHWSQVYDSVFEAYERPPDYIIEDDKALDEWLEKQHKKHEKERKEEFKKNSNPKLYNKLSTINANEVFMPVDGYYCEECTCGALLDRKRRHAQNCKYGVYFYYMDKQKLKQSIESIQENNPDNVRLTLAKEQKILESKGQVREEHLRSDNTRRLMGFNTSTHKYGEKPV